MAKTVNEYVLTPAGLKSVLWHPQPIPRGLKGRTYFLGDGNWCVQHCGHPTANFPYLGLTGEGEKILDVNGRGFQLLEHAKAAVLERYLAQFEEVAHA